MDRTVASAKAKQYLFDQCELAIAGPTDKENAIVQIPAHF